MADINIAIPYDLKLDVKQTKLLNNKDKMSCKANDSIILNIELVEDGVKKDISDDCSISLITSVELSNGTIESYRQNNKEHGGFQVIKDETSTKIIIEPMDFFTLNESKNVISEIVVSDINESIATQKFRFSVVGTLNGGIIKSAFDSINTLDELDKLIEAEKQALIDIRNEVSVISNNIDNKIVEINDRITSEDNKVDQAIQIIDDKINNMNNVIDTQVVKSIPLSIYDVSGSNVVYFITDLFNMKTSDLLDKTFVVSIGGYVASGYYNTSIGHLVFTLEGGSIKCNYEPRIDKNIGGSTVGASVLFSNMTNSIGKNITDFKLVIKTNIKKSLLNGEYNAFARITPLSNGYLH